jgi:hypothetical protein
MVAFLACVLLIALKDRWLIHVPGLTPCGRAGKAGDDRDD